ncbi:very short patch repair endonuclease [Sphaerisporangium corydalis]|uniref:Very short patch repair endonuclease n=1 Tax=Sphaerisporangium corydalis TaxID=1441875 RepID=A0ABV9ERX1_9ACTN|nr:very short patch repair endonuclease [Sphaerisporangium corydalis]
MRQKSWASSSHARAVMKGNKSKNTIPEIRIRQVLHANGLRYRVNLRPLPNLRRTADIVFTRQRIAVFVDGCFWHGCPQHYVPSKTNRHYWDAKISRNIDRDRATSATLSNAGWTVLRFWSHEDPVDVTRKIITVVQSLSSCIEGGG